MNINFPQKEKRILKFWRQNRAFERSIEQRKKAPAFVFYEGPPTANAKPGIHHVLSRIYKDIICRYKTMQGFKVIRKAGWDTHGLPVELEIEKKLGLKSKKDIEKYGIAKFNKKCKKSVWQYQRDWEKLTERIGFWLDLKNPYITYQPDYIETVWRIIKELYKKGLLYQDYKVVPYCARCGTSLSSHEVALGYKKIKEPAIYVKFQIHPPSASRRSRGKFKNTYLLVWTTTPWTLPGNVAIAVNPSFNYVKVKVDKEYLILSKERMKVFGIKGEVVQEFKGKDLLGLEYEPPYKFINPNKKAWYIIPGSFVSLEEGTGLVHIAPAFGEEDMTAGKENNLPVLLNVDEEGKFKKEVKNWAGMWVKEADSLIIKDLEKRNLLFKEESHEHDYPFCWRCSSPLLYYAKQSWFIKMQKVKEDLIANNQKINWVPAHLKKGRFGEWLREIKDWAFSRERYWGIPLPVWQCKKCGDKEVIGSKKDLINQKFSKNRYFILRHGESELQTEHKGIVCGCLKPFSLSLTRKGKRDIEIKARKLQKEKIDLIYSSDFLRTRQTAEIVAKKLGLKINLDKRLRDINRGIYVGKKSEEFFKKYPLLPESFKKRPLKGESLNDCRKRMLDFIKDIDKKYQNKTVLIISHGDPLWLLEGTINGFKKDKLLQQKLKKSIIKTGEIRKIIFRNLPHNEEIDLDFHRPYIDKVKFYCPKCGELMERTPEVIDCWFDSGSMPFAQYHYPFENQKLQKEQFPADYISEAVDQTRGWFYTLLAISTLLGKGPAYKNAISLGHVLDEKGEKMSKSKGNVVDPWQIAEKYSSDAVRWYFYTVNQPGDVKLFSEKDVDQALKKFILTFWNSFIFLKTYANKIPKSKSHPPSAGRRSRSNSKYILDRWIISKLNGLIEIVSNGLEKYGITFAARAIENFVVEDLSLWYIRRSRKRFQKPVSKKELKEASETLNFVILTLSKITAPFIPFLSEEIYRELGEKRSCHLEDWPKINKKMKDEKLEKKMIETRKIVNMALAERAKAKIKVRQPLISLQVPGFKIPKELLELIKEEVNVKKITFGKGLKLDTKITPELREEGIVREVIRQIQEMRKRAQLKPHHKVLVRGSGTNELNKILARNKKVILKEIKAEDFLLGEKPKQVFNIEREFKIEQQKLWLGLRKV